MNQQTKRVLFALLPAMMMAACSTHASAIDIPSDIVDEMAADTAELLSMEVVEPIPVEEEPEPRQEIVVRAGENLALLAGWTDSTIEDLAALNNMNVTATLRTGQRFVVPVAAETTVSLDHARQAYVDGRLERYVQQRGGLAGIAAHQVRTGETGWSISRNQGGIPAWVLAAFNPEVDLGALRIGDTVYLPVLHDTVAAAFDAEMEDGCQH